MEIDLSVKQMYISLDKAATYQLSFNSICPVLCLCISDVFTAQFLKVYLKYFYSNLFRFGGSRGGTGGGEGGAGGVRRRTVLQKTGLAPDSDYQCGPVCNNICALM